MQRNSAAQNRPGENYKGSTSAASSIQVNGTNLTDLHKNAMHIKKINFMGRGMQNHATQPVIAQ